MLIKLTFIGAYGYDNSLFDGLSLPNGVDKDAFINCFLREFGEFPLLFNDPVFLKSQIRYWSTAKSYVLTKLWETTKLKYNPINNYDMTETEELSRKYSDSGNQTGSTTENNGITRDANSADAYNVSAYNDTGYSPKDQRKTESTENENGHSNRQDSTQTTQSGSGAEERKLTRSGNIGVTTSQQMIARERDIAMFDFYSVAGHLLASDFCILLYV